MNKLESLKQHFVKVAHTMRDLPIFNTQLDVELVGGTTWAEREIGILITPWFMNLVVLPSSDDDWATQVVGNKQFITLPSGVYECIHNHADAVGGYLSCSFFSPMGQFSEQETAVETAHEVMLALFKEEHQALTDRQQALKEQALKETAQQDTPDKRNTTANKTTELKSDKIQKPAQEEPSVLSRRGFLTAGFSQTSHTEQGHK